MSERSVNWFLDSLSDEDVHAFGVVDSKSGTYGCLNGCGTEVDHFTMSRLIREAAAQCQQAPAAAPPVGGSAWLRADWMQTFSGKAFRPLDPDPALVCREDIAHALGLLCRYGGHSRRFYSVAEHCVLMSEALEREGHDLNVQRWALMHDSAEAYLGDVIRPVKRSMPTYRDAEAVLLSTIASVFGLPLIDKGRAGYPAVVTQADNRILLNERAELLSTPPQPWDLEDDLTPLAIDVAGWDPVLAEAQFLERMAVLGL